MLTKNADPDRYKYGIRFDSYSEFSSKMEAWENMSLFLELI